MKGLQALVVVALAIPLTILIVTLKAKSARRYFERYLSENSVPAEIEAIGIPPIRFWLSNRRGDSWAKLRFSDTSIKWARLRPGIFGSGSRVDLFD